LWVWKSFQELCINLVKATIVDIFGVSVYRGRKLIDVSI